MICPASTWLGYTAAAPGVQIWNKWGKNSKDSGLRYKTDPRRVALNMQSAPLGLVVERYHDQIPVNMAADLIVFFECISLSGGTEASPRSLYYVKVNLQHPAGYSVSPQKVGVAPIICCYFLWKIANGYFLLVFYTVCFISDFHTPVKFYWVTWF